MLICLSSYVLFGYKYLALNGNVKNNTKHVSNVLKSSETLLPCGCCHVVLSKEGTLMPGTRRVAEPFLQSFAAISV